MKHKNTFVKRLLLYVGLSLGLQPVLMAEKKLFKSGLLPQKASQEREDYQECLTAVIKKYRETDNPKLEKRQKAALAACRDRYPAASVLVDCKKQMATGYKDQPELLKSGLKSCQSEYRRYAFDPLNPVPLATKDERMFFAGVGMNEQTIMKATEEDETPSALYMGENFGNFSCSPLYNTMFKEASPEYTLFGTDPMSFNPLRNVSLESFLKANNYP